MQWLHYKKMGVGQMVGESPLLYVLVGQKSLIIIIINRCCDQLFGSKGVPTIERFHWVHYNGTLETQSTYRECLSHCTL